MGKKRAYSAKPSITSGDRCRASLPGLDLLLGMGAGGGPWGPQAAGLMPAAGCKPPNATQAIGPNPVPTTSRHRQSICQRLFKFQIPFPRFRLDLTLSSRKVVAVEWKSLCCTSLKWSIISGPKACCIVVHSSNKQVNYCTGAAHTRSAFHPIGSAFPCKSRSCYVQ